MTISAPVLNVGQTLSSPEPLQPYFRAYVIFTSIQENVRTDPIVKVLGIFRSGFQAKRFAREWIETQQGKWNGSPFCIMDQGYEVATRGKCVRWWTPRPYLDKIIFSVWTHRQMIYIEDAFEEEEERLPLMNVFEM
jgi:hypothetical protein